MNREFNLGDFLYLVETFRWTLLLSGIAFAGGGALGLLVAFARTSNSKVARYLSIAYIRLFQGTPLLIQLFIAFFLPGLFGYNVDPLIAAATGLSFNAAAYLGEIWRGCIEAVPKGQWEVSTSLGFRRVALLGLIILPQALRAAIPPTVGYLVQLIRDTSLASIIGFVEVSRAGYNLANATFQPFLVFSIVAIMYFCICFPLSKASVRLERRLARTQK
jgi:polar amino acid transport system permease protein